MIAIVNIISYDITIKFFMYPKKLAVGRGSSIGLYLLLCFDVFIILNVLNLLRAVSRITIILLVYM